MTTAASDGKRAGSEPSPQLDGTEPVGPELQAALLTALVLVPGSYPRNRFERLYRRPEVRSVRGRAYMVRSIISDLVQGIRGQPAQFVRCDEMADGRTALVYRVPAVGLRRTTRLSALELSLVRYVVTGAVERGSETHSTSHIAAGLSSLLSVPAMPPGELALLLVHLLDTPLLRR